MEVDLVCETDDGRVAAVQIKASARVGEGDCRALRYLRDKLGRDFVAGVVLYLGRLSYTKDDRLHVIPLDRLWSAPPARADPPMPRSGIFDGGNPHFSESVDEYLAGFGERRSL
jgi:hypothetical protein